MKKTVLVLFLFVILLISIFPIVSSSPDVLIKSPTANGGWAWTNPQYAYSSDDLCAECIQDSSHDWFDYGFNLEGSTIEKVEIGWEAIVTMNPTYEHLQLKYTVDGGSTYTLVDNAEIGSGCASASIEYNDITDDWDWIPQMLDDDHFKVRLFYDYNPPAVIFPPSGGSGESFPIDSEIALWNGTPKCLQELQKDDVLLGWDGSNFVNATIEEITWKKGKFDVIGLFAVHRKKTLGKYVQLTPDHLMPYSSEAFDTFISKPDVAIKEKRAEDFEIDDYIFGYMGGIQWEERILQPSFECYEVKDIRKLNVEFIMEIKTDCKWIFVHHPIGTARVDWLPVKVTYSPPSYEEMDCNYIGVNNTIRNQSTLFESAWDDLNDTEGISHYLFSTNNTGTWQNESWTDAWKNGVWTEAIKILNGTASLQIQFRFYVNNSVGKIYASAICFFITRSKGLGLPSGFLIAIIIFLPLIISGILYGMKKKS